MMELGTSVKIPWNHFLCDQRGHQSFHIMLISHKTSTWKLWIVTYVAFDLKLTYDKVSVPKTHIFKYVVAWHMQLYNFGIRI